MSVGVTYAQAPQAFNYQGVARSTEGKAMANQKMTLRLSIIDGAENGEVVYQETQEVTTNQFGLYNIQIGTGTGTFGEFKNIAWEKSNKYIRVEVDMLSGTGFEQLATTQLLSVPYALYANTAGTADQANNVRQTRAGSANYLSKFDATGSSSAEINSQLFDNGTSVGLGTIAPDPTTKLQINRTGNGAFIRMVNTDPAGVGTFRLINDVPANFATFSKYGSTVAGGYSGIATLYPYANILGYGNNGPFLNAGTGNIGFAITKAGTNKLKIHIDAASENVGLGGNSVPQALVHINTTDRASDTLKMTNNTTGHAIGDGFDIRQTGNTVRMVNLEPTGNTIIGTNGADRLTIDPTGNVGIGTVTPGARLEVNGQVKITGGAPGAGKVLTSDATGLATWQTPTGGGLTGSGTLNYVPKFTPTGTAVGNSQIVDDGTTIGIAQSPTTVGRVSIRPNYGSSGLFPPAAVAVDSFSNGIGVMLNPTTPLPVGNQRIGFVHYSISSGDSAYDYAFYGESYSPNAIGLYSSSNGTGLYSLSQFGSILSSFNKDNAALAVNNGGNGRAIDAYADSSIVGYFYTNDDVNSHEAGVLVGEYLPLTPNTIDDHVGVYGKSQFGDQTNYGIGVKGEGGFFGVYGITDSAGSAGVIGIGEGSTTGGNFDSEDGNGVVASSSSASSAALAAQNYGGGQAATFQSTSTTPTAEVTNYGNGSALRASTFAAATTGSAASLSGNSSWAIVAGSSSFDAAFISASGIGDGVVSQAYGTGSAFDALSIKGYGVRANVSDSTLPAGYFTTNNTTGNNYNRGIVAADYLGNDSLFDHVGVKGTVLYNTYNTNYGIGVQGDGGYRGVYGRARNKGTGAVYGVIGATNTNVGQTGYAIYGSSSGSGTNYAGYFSGDIYATTGTFGTKPFTIDHPLDPANKILRHSSIESPDMMNMYNGNIVTDANGDATVFLPDYFAALNKDFKYQLTVIGSFAQAIIAEEVANNQFKIKTDKPNVKVSWQVTGVRHDAVATKFPIIVEENKPANLKGKYFEPTAYGVSETLGIAYDAHSRQEDEQDDAARLAADQAASAQNAAAAQAAKAMLEAPAKVNTQAAQANAHKTEAPKARGTNAQRAAELKAKREADAAKHAKAKLKVNGAK
jgi:hypothetical protein